MNSLKLESAPLFALAIICLFRPAAIAQHIRGALEGRVVDPNGAFVRNAQVKARNVSTNAEVNTTSNESGAFSLRNLEPGEYEVTIEGSGFRTFLAKQVIVKVGSVTPLDVRLEMGEANAVIHCALCAFARG